MSAVEIDIEAMAREIIEKGPRANPSVLAVHAMALWIIERIEAEATIPPTCATLAATLALTIKAHDALVKARNDPAVFGMGKLDAETAFDTAFATLQTLFEKEFPDGNDDDQF